MPTCASTVVAMASVGCCPQFGMTQSYNMGAPVVWGNQSGITQSYTAMKPRQTDGSTAEYRSILSEIDAFLESRNGMSICDLKTEYPEYGALIAEIKASGDKHPNICFSTEEAWARRADLRARVVQVLTNVGILQPVAEVQAVPEAIAVTPEPALVGHAETTTTSSGVASSHADVLSKISAYLATKNLEICDLRSAIPAYGEIIDKLDKDQKYKPELGAPTICYPSPEVWEADTDGVKTEIMSVLKANGIL